MQCQHHVGILAETFGVSTNTLSRNSPPTPPSCLIPQPVPTAGVYALHSIDHGVPAPVAVLGSWDRCASAAWSVGLATQAAFANRTGCAVRELVRADAPLWTTGRLGSCKMCSALQLFSETSSTVCSAAAAQGPQGGSPQSCDAVATSPILQPGSSLQSSLWRRRRRFEGAKHQIQQNHILSKVPSTIIHTAGLRPLSFV